MFKDDIEVQFNDISSGYNPMLVLSEQIRLIRKYLPSALLGTVFSSFCFFITVFITYDLNDNEKVMNVVWFVYHAIVVGILWLCLQRIFEVSRTLDQRSLKVIFSNLVCLFSIGLLFGITILLRMLIQPSETNLNATTIMWGMWVFFHIIILYVCWLFWKKLILLASSLSTELMPISTNNDCSSANHFIQENSLSIQYKHLVHYAAYSALFICSLAVASLWALAIGTVLTTNIESSTQIIVLMGLHFGLLSGGISSLATFWQVYVAYVVPSIFVWTFLLFYLEGTEFTIMALGLLALLFFNIYFAQQAWQNTLKGIFLYLENNSLVAELQVKTKQVEQASLAKTQFLAAASHDLRQPVHALSLFIEALSDTTLDDHQSQIVQYAKSASQSSREMLNNILEFAHLESGQMKPNFLPTDLDSIIKHLIDEFGIQASNKGLTIRYNPTELWSMTDPTMIALILRNFISNAIRYTHKGSIVIEVHKLAVEDQAILIDYCKIAVWDTGTGMTAIEMQHIFDSFYQIEKNKTNEKGLGLGLAIVKAMTKILNIDLKVQSEVGRGSQFSVVIPTCLPTHNLDTSSKEELGYLKGKMVLIIDDDDSVLKSMQLLLQTWGCQTIAVKTVFAANAAYLTYEPDIVITDFRLADGATGEDVIIAIKQSSKAIIPTPFIMLTADTSPQLFATTKAINLTVLHKPIDPKTLRQHLQKIIKLQDALKV